MSDLEKRLSNLEERLSRLEDAAVVPEKDKVFLNLHSEERKDLRRITKVVMEKIALEFLKEKCPALEEKRLQNGGEIPALRYVEKLPRSLRKQFSDYLNNVVKGLINAHKN